MNSDTYRDEDSADDRHIARLDDLRSRVTDAAGLARIPPPVPLVEGWLNCDSLAWLIGEPGHCKSLVAQDLTGCVSTGKDWHGYAVKQANVLYVVMEGAPGLNQRIRVWEDYHTTAMAARFLVPRGPLHIVADAAELADLAAELEAGLLFLDTQNRASVGLDESSCLDMGRLVAGMDLIRERSHACVVSIHHTALGSKRPRGHTSIDGAADAMIRVAKDGGVVKVENRKQKDGRRAPSVVMNATEHAGGLVLAGVKQGEELAETDSERKALAALRDIVATRGTATHAEWKQAACGDGMAPGTFNWVLRRLRERGLVTREGSRGTWRLADPTQGTFGDSPKPGGMQW